MDSTLHWRTRLLGLMLGLSAMALALVASGLGLYVHMLSDQATQLSANSRALFRVLEQGDQTLDRLNALAFTDCRLDSKGGYDANLATMHLEQSTQSFIADIAFYENDVLRCSTSRGVIDSSFRDGPPDLVTATGTEIWFNQPLFLFLEIERFEGGTFMVLRRGRYNLAINTDDIEALIQWRGGSGVHAMFSGTPRHLLGNANLMESPAGVASIKRGFHVSRLCNERPFQHCHDVSTTLPVFVGWHRDIIVTCLVFSAAIGLLAGLFAVRYLHRRYSLVGRILRGLAAGQIYPLYQPVAHLGNGANIGCEVLPGLVDRFGEIASKEVQRVVHEHGLCWQLTVALSQRAATELARYSDWPEKFQVAFNVMPDDLLDHRANDFLAMKTLDHERFQYVIEVSEHGQLTGEAMQETLRSMTNAGFSIVIDHFGTGYANLASLRQVPCNGIKIDASLTRDAESQSLRSSLIPAIVGVAAEAGVAVIAEGVDNPLQAEVLLHTGIAIGQGAALGEAGSIDALHEQTRQSIRNPITDPRLRLDSQ